LYIIYVKCCIDYHYFRYISILNVHLTSTSVAVFFRLLPIRYHRKYLFFDIDFPRMDLWCSYRTIKYIHSRILFNNWILSTEWWYKFIYGSLCFFNNYEAPLSYWNIFVANYTHSSVFVFACSTKFNLFEIMSLDGIGRFSISVIHLSAQLT